MTTDEGEPTEFVEVQQLESFVETEPEELEDADLSEYIRFQEHSEFSMEFRLSRAARRRLLQRTWGWEAKGHIRKKPLLEAINALARSDLVEYDDAYWRYFVMVCRSVYELVNLSKGK